MSSRGREELEHEWDFLSQFSRKRNQNFYQRSQPPTRVKELPRGGDPESATQQSSVALKPTGPSTSETMEASDAQETGLRLKEATVRLSVVRVTHISAYKRIWKLLNVYLIFKRWQILNFHKILVLVVALSFCFGIVIAYCVRVLVLPLPYKTGSSSAVTVWQMLSSKGLPNEREWCKDVRQVMSEVGLAVKEC